MANRFFPASVLGVLAILLPIATAFADSEKASKDDALIAMGLCSEMERLINTLVDYTSTKCIPALDKNGTNFIFVSEKPVFSVPASEKAWALVVAAAVGKTMNYNSSYKSNEVFVADAGMAKDKKFYKFDTDLAKSLQRKVYSGEVSPDVMWIQLKAALTPYTVPEK